MNRQLSIPALTCALIAGFVLMTAPAAKAQTPMSLASASVTLEGTSNVHDFTATTKDVKLTKLSIAGSAPAAAALANPTVVDGFEIAIKAATLKSSKDGLDKNMHKALKAAEFPDIVFRLVKFEGQGPAIKAFGVLKVAGVEKDVVLDLKVVAAAATLTVTGQVPLLMTDYGITPPKMMLGALKTSPKIRVKFETVLAAPSTF